MNIKDKVNDHDRTGEALASNQDDKIGNDLLTKVHTSQKFAIAAEVIGLIKSITYLAFGVLAVIALIAPAISIPAALVWGLTVATIVTTIVKHFLDEANRNQQATLGFGGLDTTGLSVTFTRV